MRHLIITFCTAATMFASCGNAGKKEDGDNKIIKDEKLYSFMLGGVYIFQGFGGVKEVKTNLITQMDSKPGDKDFTRDLHSAYSTYFVFPYQPEEAANIKQSLAEYWNMTDAASYKSGMERLLNHGHQEHFQQTLANIDAGIAPAEDEKDHFDFVKTHRSQFPIGGIKSWDIARYVNNIALGYAAGYITKPEAEALLETVPAIARNAYANWDDYWKGFSLGRKYWGGDKNNDAAFDVDIKEMQEGDYSIYKHMPFK